MIREISVEQKKSFGVQPAARKYPDMRSCAETAKTMDSKRLDDILGLDSPTKEFELVKYCMELSRLQ